MTQRNGATSAPIPVIKPINHAIIERRVILSSRVKSRTSVSAGKNCNANRQTTNALIAPSAKAVTMFNRSIIGVRDFPAAAAG